MIVHVASGREWRGGQHQVLLLARGLHEAGVATIVVTGTGTELARRLRDAGVPVEAVHWAAGLDPRVAVRLVRVLAPGTIVHAHDGHGHALADLAARIRRAPVVVTRRVTFPVHNRRRLRRASAVIAISGAVRDELLRAGADPARIHLVPDAFDPGGMAADAALPRAPLPPLVVCVAALAAEKGIDTLIDAAALLHATHPAVRWRVAGDGDAHAGLVEQRRRLGLDAVVAIDTAPTSAAAAFRDAMIAVLPSRSEGLGSAALQALALGVPLVVSDAGGLPDTVAHGGGVVVPHDAPVELARAVARLVDDPSERSRLGTAGRAAAGHFSVERLVERTRRVYRSVAPTWDEG